MKRTWGESVWEKTGLATGVAAIACLVLAQFGTAAQSRPAGEPDRSFGGDGVVSVGFGGKNHKAGMGIAPAPGGKIVQGVLKLSGRTGLVLRYLPGGKLDRSLGRGGRARLEFKTGQVNPRDVLAGSKGRILATGEAYIRADEGWSGGIAKLRPGGRPDRSFAGDGLAVLPGPDSVTPYEIVFDRKGRIVVAGMVGGIPSARVYVARFRPNGRPDRTFSGNGYRVIRHGSAQAWRSVTIDSRQRIVLGTGSRRGNSQTLTVIRLKPGGASDRSFSGDGIATVVPDPGGGSTQMEDVAVDRRDRVLAVGSAYNGSIVRFRENGRLDRSFGKRGTVELNWFSPSSVTVDRRQRIVISGGDENIGARVIRLKPNGLSDHGFDGTISRMGYFEDHYLDSRGRIVAGGSFSPTRAGVARITGQG